MNFGEVSCSPFIFSRLNMEEDRRGIRVGLISIRPVEDAVFCEELALNRFASITLAIGERVSDGVTLYIFIMELDKHST